MARECPVCGGEVVGRRDKVYCSQACRNRHFVARGAARDSSRRYYASDPEKCREAARRYRKNSPEKARVACRRYRKTHLAESREASRRYRKANPDRVREYNRCYREANLDELRVKARRKKSALKPAKLLPDLINLLGKFDGQHA